MSFEILVADGICTNGFDLRIPIEPAEEGVAVLCDVCRQGRADALRVAGHIPTVDRAAVCIQRDGVGDRNFLPMSLEILVAGSICANDFDFCISIKPAEEGVAVLCNVCRQGRADALRVAGHIPTVDRAAVCVQRNGVGDRLRLDREVCCLALRLCVIVDVVCDDINGIFAVKKVVVRHGNDAGGARNCVPLPHGAVFCPAKNLITIRTGNRRP